MYYRVAIQTGQPSTWQWKSTPLSSLNTLLQWLQFYRAFPHDRLRLFSSCSRETLNEQLVRENQGLESTSVPATQFLQERGFTPRGAVREASAGGSRAHERTTTIPAETGGTPDESRSVRRAATAAQAPQWTLHTYVCAVWEEPGRMRRAQRQGVSYEHLHLWECRTAYQPAV